MKNNLYKNYRDVCLQSLEKVRSVIEKIMETEMPTENTYIDGCQIDVEDYDYGLIRVNHGEIYGYLEYYSRNVNYNADEIDGVSPDFGDYDSIKDGILNADNELIENSTYANEWKYA